MKKNLIVASIFFSATVFLTSCSKFSTIPKCDDPGILQTVCQINQNETNSTETNDLAGSVFAENNTCNLNTICQFRSLNMEIGVRYCSAYVGNTGNRIFYTIQKPEDKSTYLVTVYYSHFAVP